MFHKKNKRNLSSMFFSIRSGIGFCLSFMFCNLFINILLDSALNFYVRLGTVDTYQKAAYITVICMCTICLLMIIASLYLNKNSNPIGNRVVLATNLIYISILILYYLCILNGIFYKYWSVQWITYMYFGANLFVAFISLGINILGFF
jgi:hypothetical protein